MGHLYLWLTYEVVLDQVNSLLPVDRNFELFRLAYFASCLFVLTRGTLCSLGDLERRRKATEHGFLTMRRGGFRENETRVWAVNGDGGAFSKK